MGRSIEVASGSGLLNTLRSPVTVHSDKLNRTFEVFAKASDLYQREYAIENGVRAFESTYKLEYLIGSGENGITPVVRRGNFLMEAPLTYYAKPAAWGLSPGFDSADSGFNRPILEQCIRCHSGNPQPAASGNGRYEEPAFKEMAIGCENCHGAGAAHVELRAKGVKVPGADLSIVNPVKLPSALADEICMSCHQGGDTRILQPGKTYSDVHPGTPLAETIAIFKLQPKRRESSEKDLLEHNAAITLSKCYRASGGKLSCLTCHDPHQQRTGAEAVTYYRDKCLRCHTEASCKIPLATRGDDCKTCHMPKRAVAEISHSALTNHRIVTRADEPLPDEYYTRATPGLPGLLYVDRPAKSATLPLLTRLAAYGELQEQAPELGVEYLKTFEEARKQLPHEPLVMAAEARQALIESRYGEAARLLERATAGAAPPSPWMLDLARALSQSGKEGEAVNVLDRASKNDPYSTTVQKTEILTLINLHDYPRALTAMRQYVNTFPEDLFMRGLLKKVDSSQSPPH